MIIKNITNFVSLRKVKKNSTFDYFRNFLKCGEFLQIFRIAGIRQNEFFVKYKNIFFTNGCVKNPNTCAILQV